MRRTGAFLEMIQHTEKPANSPRIASVIKNARMGMDMRTRRSRPTNPMGMVIIRRTNSTSLRGKAMKSGSLGAGFWVIMVD